MPAPSTPRLLDLPQLTLRGSVAAMGQQHGEALRQMIQAFVPMRFEATAEFLAGMGLGSVGQLVDVGRQCLEVYARWHPEGYAEHCAIAKGAGVDAGELYTAANMTDVRDVLAFNRPVQQVNSVAPRPLPADAEGCSVALVSAARGDGGQAVVGQTWDLNPQDLDYVVAFHRLADDGPETWSVSCSGCLSLVGMNQHGLAVGTTNIKTHGSKVGVGYMGVLHKMLNSRSYAEAAAACLDAPRAAAHTYWLADAERQTEWETTAWSAVERHPQRGLLLRTNHCLIADHAAVEGEAPSASSQARLRRMSGELGDRQGVTLLDLREMFADRRDGVDSLNRLPEDAQGTATNSVVVGIPAKRELWACRGPADRGDWQRLEFERP